MWQDFLTGLLDSPDCHSPSRLYHLEDCLHRHRATSRVHLPITAHMVRCLTQYCRFAYIYIHASKCHSFNNFEAFQFGSSSHSAQVLVAKHVFDSWISVLIVGGIIAYAGPPAYAPSPPPYTYSPPSYGEFLLHCVHNVACLPSILPATSELQQLAHIWCPGPPPYTPPPYAYSPPSYGESLLHCLLCCSTV